MRDTPFEMERMVRNKIMARSGEMRFIMGAQMFDSAREIVKACLPKKLVRNGMATPTIQTHLWEGTQDRVIWV
jgi:hypothetical protein